MRRGSMEKCYTVAETVKLTGVKSYVLRYWEDELSLPIRRNELGHRCYTQDDIQLFLNIKELKNRGLQLRAIHDLLPKLTKKEGMEVIVPEEKDKIHLLESESIEKEENETRDTLREELLENVQNFKAEPDKKILEFQEILERLITQELHAQKEGEDRWRTLDAAIRRQQMAKGEYLLQLHSRRTTPEICGYKAPQEISWSVRPEKKKGHTNPTTG
jgi:DNA-binding transcriptional MerR regulator